MTNNITQGSPKWLQIKQSKIGGSSIYALACYYCPKELEQIGVDIIKEPAFQTALELYLKVKFDIKGDPISQVNSEFGLGMENYILSRLNQESELIHEGSRNFFLGEKIHPLACCSPDGFIQIKEGQILRDFDDKCDITEKMGKGMLEVKTTPFAFNLKDKDGVEEYKKGAKFQYLFQTQYNSLILGNEWSGLVCATPKERDYDTDFFKGQTIGKLQAVDIIGRTKENYNSIIEHLNKYYNLYTYIYPTIKPIQEICKLALDRFQTALDNNKLPNPSRDNKVKLTREKKMLAKVYPERFDTLKADEELNGLLNDRMEASKQALIDDTAKHAIEAEILKKIGDHIEVEGVMHAMKFDKRGTMRFRKLKT
jgi:hypothetical protein